MRCILVVEYLALLVEELLSVLDVDLSLLQVLGLAQTSSLFAPPHSADWVVKTPKTGSKISSVLLRIQK